MSTLNRDMFESGQALIEGLLALTVLGILLRGVLTLGALAYDNNRNVSSARVVAFQRGSSDSPDSLKTLLPPIGNTDAHTLESAWLEPDAQLVFKETPIPSAYVPPSSADRFGNRKVTMLHSVGQPFQRASLSERIQESELGWMRAAVRTCQAQRSIITAIGISLGSASPVECGDYKYDPVLEESFSAGGSNGP